MNHSKSNMPNAAAQSPATAPVCSQDRPSGTDHPARESSANPAQEHGQPPGVSEDGVRPQSLTRREALAHYEHLIEESLAREDQRAAALLSIHDQRLYQLTHQRFADYLKARWGLSRSRGYQLLHHAKLMQSCRSKGEPPPANEREARRLAADGSRKTPSQETYDLFLKQITHYITKKVAQLKTGERQRLLQDLRAVLGKLEEGPAQMPPQANPVGPKEPGPPANAPTTTATPARQATAVPTRVAVAAEAHTIQPNNQLTQASAPNGPPVAEEGDEQAEPPARNDDAQRPRLPQANAGVLALSMETARRLRVIPP